MKAKDISGQAPGGKRTNLAQVLPLKAPFLVQIFPIYACNFKCNYCIFQIEESKRHFISDKVMMDLNLYKKCIDDMAKSWPGVKLVRFVGIGEPLLHPHIAKMVKYTVDKNVAKTVEIITNASLLIPKMSDSLISAGLSRLVVSLQGTNAEKYQKISRVKIDFTKFVANLRYFFKHKGKTQMYLKIVDSALDNKDDEKRFYKIFGDICDTIAIEHTVPIHAGIKYKKVLRGKNVKVTQFGLPVGEVKICPQPFFTMQINPDGKVVPCFSFEYPQIIGDCNRQSIPQIWKGKKFQHFRRLMLDGIKGMGNICANCNIIKYRLFPEDDLTGDAQRLKKYYE
jgi:radical SAM protein with 4Fe4S-binding SPASM domain